MHPFTRENCRREALRQFNQSFSINHFISRAAVRRIRLISRHRNDVTSRDLSVSASALVFCSCAWVISRDAVDPVGVLAGWQVITLCRAMNNVWPTTLCFDDLLILFNAWCKCQVDHFCYQSSACLCMQSAILFGQFCLYVCPCVRLSDQCRYCVKTNGHVTLFSRSGRVIIQLFSALPPLQNYKGNPLRGALKLRSGENLANFAIYLENGTRYVHSYGTLVGSHR